MKKVINVALIVVLISVLVAGLVAVIVANANGATVYEQVAEWFHIGNNAPAEGEDVPLPNGDGASTYATGSEEEPHDKNEVDYGNYIVEYNFGNVALSLNDPKNGYIYRLGSFSPDRKWASVIGDIYGEQLFVKNVPAKIIERTPKAGAAGEFDETIRIDLLKPIAQDGLQGGWSDTGSGWTTAGAMGFNFAVFIKNDSFNAAIEKLSEDLTEQKFKQSEVGLALSELSDRTATDSLMVVWKEAKPAAGTSGNNTERYISLPYKIKDVAYKVETLGEGDKYFGLIKDALDVLFEVNQYIANIVNTNDLVGWFEPYPEEEGDSLVRYPIDRYYFSASAFLTPTAVTERPSAVTGTKDTENNSTTTTWNYPMFQSSSADLPQDKFCIFSLLEEKQEEKLAAINKINLFKDTVEWSDLIIVSEKPGLLHLKEWYQYLIDRKG